MFRMTTRILLASGLMSVMSAQAADSLSCRIQANQIAGNANKPRVTDFVWSAAHGTDEGTRSIKTRIGLIGQAGASGPATVLNLNGKELSMPTALAGSVRFGKVYDYGDKVALAYLVERADDSSASPSQVVLLLGRSGTVLETDLLPGTAAAVDTHCVLVQ